MSQKLRNHNLQFTDWFPLFTDSTTYLPGLPVTFSMALRHISKINRTINTRKRLK